MVDIAISLEKISMKNKILKFATFLPVPLSLPLSPYSPTPLSFLSILGRGIEKLKGNREIGIGKEKYLQHCFTVHEA